MSTENRNSIIQELQEIAPQLAKMEKKNPFLLPEGYFDAQADALGFAVSGQDDSTLTSSGLAALKAVNPFTVPSQYFNELFDWIKLSISAQSAEPVLGEFLSTQKGKNPFQVPSQYFAEFGSKISARVSEVGISSAKAKESFKVPNGYFDELPNRILEKVKAQETAQGITRETDGARAPKVIEMAPEKAKGGGIRRLLTFATAAAAILLLTFVGPSIVKSFQGETIVASYDLEKAFSELSDDDINYLFANADYDSDELEGYINTNDFLDLDDLDDDLLREMMLEEFDESFLNTNVL